MLDSRKQTGGFYYVKRRNFLGSAKGEEFAEKYSFLFTEREERGYRQLRNSVWCRICYEYILKHVFGTLSLYFERSSTNALKNKA